MGRSVKLNTLSYCVGIAVATSLWIICRFPEPRIVGLLPFPPGFLEIIGQQFYHSLPGGMLGVIATIPVYGLLLYLFSRFLHQKDLYAVVAAGLSGTVNCFLLLLAWTTSVSAIEGPHEIPPTIMDSFPGTLIVASISTISLFFLGLLFNRLLPRSQA